MVCRFTKRQWLTLIVISIADFANAICVSLQAPFYPQEVCLTIVSSAPCSEAKYLSSWFEFYVNMSIIRNVGFELYFSFFYRLSSLEARTIRVTYN